MPNYIEKKVQCPYNSSHVVLKMRMAAHLIKCRKQYQGDKFSICPFNASHTVYTPELQYHAETCPDRKNLDKFKYVISDTQDDIITKNSVDVILPPSSENWDDEVPAKSTSYLDVKENIISKLPVFRIPVGQSKAKRRKFLEDEAKRFDDISKGPVKETSDDCKFILTKKED